MPNLMVMMLMADAQVRFHLTFLLARLLYMLVCPSFLVLLLPVGQPQIASPRGGGGYPGR